jgi:hypothetical protein
MPPGTHLGIGQLVDRAGCTAVPATGAKVTIDGNTKRKEERCPFPLHSLEDPSAFQHPVRARLNTQTAPYAVPFVDTGYPAIPGMNNIDRPGCRARHHTEESMLAGFPGWFGESPEV